MGRMIALVMGVAFGLAGLAGSASAWNAVLPVASSLSAVPSSVSYPGSPDFQYRIALTAGPNGAHFILTAPQPRWGISGMQGSPFSIKPPTLDGPGTLAPAMTVTTDPVPWACYRGAYAGSQSWYELTLDPNLSTTIVYDAKAEAAPIAGMNTDMGVRLENQDYPILLHVQTPVGGKPGVRIVSQIAGTKANLLASRGNDGRFRIKGYTDPPVANRKIDFAATVVLGKTPKGTPKKLRIPSVKTDAEGKFMSNPVHLDNEPDVTLAIKSRLHSPGRFAADSNCGPALRIGKGR